MHEIEYIRNWYCIDKWKSSNIKKKYLYILIIQIRKWRIIKSRMKDSGNKIINFFNMVNYKGR